MPHRTRSGHAPLAATLALLLLAQATPAATEQAPDPPQEPPRRSPWVALGLSLGSTLVTSGLGVGLLLSARSADSDLAEPVVALSLLCLSIGPAVGRFYTDQPWLGIGTTVGRGLAGAAAVFGHTARFCIDDDCHQPNGAKALAWLGLLSWAGLTLYDIIDAPYAAWRFNERAEREQFTLGALLLPPPAERPGAGPAVALGLSGRF